MSLLILLALVPMQPGSDQNHLKLSNNEQALIELTNAERKKADLPQLRADPKLMSAARSHALNMAKQSTLSHELDGKTMTDRIKAEGYEFSRAGENIAWNDATPKAALATWMGSAPHKENILTKEFSDIGVGVATDAKGERYWVQVFATPLKE